MATNLIMASDITDQYSKFRDFLHDIGLSDSVIEDYTKNIFQIDQAFMKKKAGCQSVYQITDRILLKAVIDALPERYPLWTSRFRLPLDRYMQFLQVVDERDIVEKRSKAFCAFLEKKLLINRSDAEHYSNILRSPRIIDTMMKSFGVSSVYCIDNESVLKQVKTLFSGTGIDSHNRFCNVVGIYANWIGCQRTEVKAAENIEPTTETVDLQKAINDREEIISDLKAQLAEKDAEISSLKKQIETKDEESEQRDELRELLTLDAVMQHCNENCTEPSEVKAILDMLSELYGGVKDKRWTNAKKELRKRIKALKNPMSVGTLVMEQNIGHNVGNVESGATGIKLVGGSKA